MLPYLKNERVPLKKDSEYNENWVQERITDDPSILDLGEGELVLLDRERTQPSGGRLDLLLSNGEKSRYEVELQLGSVDESHIIRTIEYWDKERKRFPEYDHCAVLVAEDVTSRFLNVIELFNGAIPLILVKMQALKVGEHLTLVFTKVLDKKSILGISDEREETPLTNREHLETVMGTKETVALADKMLDIAHDFSPTLKLKYNKRDIELTRDGCPLEFMIFIPQKKGLRLNIRIEKSDEIDKKLSSSTLDILQHTGRSYCFRLYADVMENKEERETLRELAKLAFDKHHR